MDVAVKQKDGFIFFKFQSPEEITREQAQYIQEKHGNSVDDSGFYAFVRKKRKQVFEASWCCRDDDNLLSNVIVNSL
jgi:hypothetical protein